MVQFWATRPWARASLGHSRVKTGLLRVIWNDMMRIHHCDMTHSSGWHNSCGATFTSVTWLVQNWITSVSQHIKHATFPVYVVCPRWSCIAPPSHASLSSAMKSASSSWSCNSNAWCVRAHVHIHKYIRTWVHICIFMYQFWLNIYKPRAESPLLRGLELTAQSWSTTNIARSIEMPRLSTTFLVQSRIGNIPAYTHTHTHTHTRSHAHVVGTSTCIHVLPTRKSLIECPGVQICWPPTMIDMLSRRTSGTLRRMCWRSGVRLPLRCVGTSSGWTCHPRPCSWKTLFGCRSYQLQSVAGLWHQAQGWSVQTTIMHAQIIAQALIPVVILLVAAIAELFATQRRLLVMLSALRFWLCPRLCPRLNASNL